MTRQIDDLLIQLADAMQADQHLVTGVKGTKYNAFEMGEYIFSVQVSNNLAGEPIIDIFTQWPRLHRWIREQLDDHIELDFDSSPGSASPDHILVKVNEPGSKIQRTAFLTREVMLDMLKEHDVSEQAYSVDSSTETLWNKVLAYECL